MGRKLRHNKRKKPSYRKTMAGRVELHGTHLYVTLEDDSHLEYPIKDEWARGACEGDRVYVAISDERARKQSGGRARSFARVVQVVERAHSDFAGELIFVQGQAFAGPLNSGIPYLFLLEGFDAFCRDAHIQPQAGDIVRAQIISYPGHKMRPVARVYEVQSQDTFDKQRNYLLEKFKLSDHFSQQVLEEARSFTQEGVKESLPEDLKRKDHTKDLIVTIDPATAKDFDDAISVSRRTDGGWHVDVHIADVSHFVRLGMACDYEAMRRGCSVYLADSVIPMLPEELSNDLCSLMPGVSRYALSCFMDFDAKAHMIDARFDMCEIVSKARLTYDEVDAYFEQGEDARLQEALVRAGNQADLKSLRELLESGREFLHARTKLLKQRGMLEFESVEARVVCDDEGHPEGVSIRRKTEATELVEMCMLAANEAVAKRLSAVSGEDEASALFRTHASPDREKLRAARPILQELKLLTPELEHRLLSADPHAIQAILDACPPHEKMMVSQVLLRCQMRAIYEPRDIGHYGIAADHYTHFTSPIRRYPDLVVHRALKRALARERGMNEKALVQTNWNQKKMPLVVQTASSQERNADLAARLSQDQKMAELYQARLGQIESGHVSGLIASGIFVTLSGTYADVFVRLARPGSPKMDGVQLDEQRQALRLDASGRELRLGSAVTVQIERVDTIEGKIDARLAQA